jgi:hypothetical protein
VVVAGTGGLCLAPGLRAVGVNVRVSSDRTPRIGNRDIGRSPPERCGHVLLGANFAPYIAASAKISTVVTFLDHQLRRLLLIELSTTDPLVADGARPICRMALRQILRLARLSTL